MAVEYGMMPWRRLGWLLALGMLNGCAASVMTTNDAGVDDFPKYELAFRVKGSQSEVRDEVILNLSARNMPYRVEVRLPNEYVVTAYVIEPLRSNEMRRRKTAYRITIGSTPAPCSPVSVAWLTKSQGVREESWTIQEADATYEPASWPQM